MLVYRVLISALFTLLGFKSLFGYEVNLKVFEKSRYLNGFGIMDGQY